MAHALQPHRSSNVTTFAVFTRSTPLSSSHRVMRASACLLLAAFVPAPLVAQAPPQPARALADTTTYVPRHQLPNGRQLVVVFVGGDEAMRIPQFVASVRSMKPMLARQAAQRGIALSITGVSLDWDVEQGISNLRAMGAWDEIVVGNNWINAGAQHWVWRPDGRASTPQIAVYERTVDGRGSSVAFGAERYVARFEGIEPIVDWVQRGAPLPADEPR
jgi:hypothetical protein